jgi:phosphatidylinositol alpha-1,6-mannosyltransferase
MKRLLFSPGFPPFIGGQPSYMYARCLAAPEGLEVIAARCDGCEEFDARQSFVIYRFDYSYAPASPMFEPFRRILQLQQTASILKHIMAQRRYDVLEVGTVFPGAIVAQWLPQRRDFYLVSYALGDDVLRPQRTWYARPLFYQALKKVDLFVAISRYTKKLLLDVGVPSDRVVIIQPPIDQERFTKQGNGASIRAILPPHDLILLTICRLSKKKGVDRIIELMPRLKRRFPGLLYVVGGDGEDLPRLRMLAHRYNVADSVIFLGRVPEERLVDVYAAGDVFVMLTQADLRRGRVEGFGIAFLEAGSQGLPVIGPKEGGSTDAIINGVTGYLVDPYDLNDIESRIVELLSDPDLRRKFGEAGRERAFQPTDWSPLLNLGKV